VASKKFNRYCPFEYFAFHGHSAYFTAPFLGWGVLGIGGLPTVERGSQPSTDFREGQHAHEFQAWA